MMRQPVGVGLERGVAQRAVLEHHRHRIRRARRLRRKQLRQRRAAVTVAASAAPASPSPGVRQRRPSGCAVSFQPAGWCRARPRPGSQAGRARGCGVRNRSPQQPHQPLAKRLAPSQRRTGRWHIPARRRCRPAAPSAARRSISPTDRSNFALAVATGCGRTASPGRSSPPPPRSASNASITWNSGCRDSDRAGLSTSTSRSNGRSWHGHRPQGCRRAPGRSARGSPGCPTCRCAAPAC